MDAEIIKESILFKIHDAKKNIAIWERAKKFTPGSHFFEVTDGEGWRERNGYYLGQGMFDVIKEFTINDFKKKLQEAEAELKQLKK